MNTQSIKSSNPIETVAARYATLHRAGANYKMLCPFHDDHHPSLALHVAGQFFKCHACGAGGDVIALVMGLERCSFKEAVEKLGGAQEPEGARKQGRARKQKNNPVPVLDTGPQRDRQNQKIKGDTVGASAVPCQAREQGSASAVPCGGASAVPCGSASAATLAPLREANRRFLAMLMPVASGHTELSPTWLDFGVGLAPAMVPNDFYKMRSRIIFPIHDARGQLTGFGARATGDEQPKYVNSPASPLFDKSHTLYGLHRAAEAIRHEGFAYVVEGYKDVLAMHAAGFCNTVGLCSASLTDGQADMLASLTSRLHVLLDSDTAGREGTARILRRQSPRFGIRPLHIPSGEDPDELFRRLGRDCFRAYLRHLSATSCLCARRLLAYCLRHPEAAPHLLRMLEADDMLFADADYTELLRLLCLSPRPAEEDWPAELRLLADLLREALPGLLPAVPLPAGVPVGMLAECTIAPPPPELELDTLRLEYYEERLIADCRLLRNALRQSPASSRPQHLACLATRLRTLRTLTTTLLRTPAVGERWF